MKEKVFNVTRNDEGKVIGIEFNAEGFIIPNHAGRIEDFWSTYAAKRAKDLATNVLGREPEESEKYVQMWYVVKDLRCDNLVDHGTRVEIDGKDYGIHMDSCLLPYSALRDKDDGDVIDVTFLNGRRDWDDEDEDESDLKITMHVTLNQRDYRYRNFGSFQNVLWKVTR